MSKFDLGHLRRHHKLQEENTKSLFILSLLTLFILPIRNSLVIDFGIKITVIWPVVVALLHLFIYKIVTENIKIIINYVHIALVSLVLISGVSSLWSVDILSTTFQTIKFLYLTALSVILSSVMYTRERIELGLQAVVIASLVWSLFAVVQFIMEFWMGVSVFGGLLYGRASPFGMNPNNLANKLVLSIPISYYLSKLQTGKVKYINWIYLIIGGTSVILSGSRGSIVPLFGVLLYILYSEGKQLSSQKSLITIFISFTAAIGLFYILPQTLKERIASIVSIVSDFDVRDIYGSIESIDNRGELWIAAIDTISKHPVAGVGSGNVRVIGNTAHSVYLRFLVELGILGLAPLALAFFLMLKLSIQKRSNLWIGTLLSFALLSIANDWNFELMILLSALIPSYFKVLD